MPEPISNQKITPQRDAVLRNGGLAANVRLRGQAAARPSRAVTCGLHQNLDTSAFRGFDARSPAFPPFQAFSPVL